jgi:hypothetical protein
MAIHPKPVRYASMADRIVANSVLSEESFYNGTPCWIWMGAIVINSCGMPYGRLSVRISKGPRKGKTVKMLAHRVAVTAFKKRKLSKRQVVRHLCNFSLCVNPAHLVGGTQTSNVRQCVREGRHRNGHTGRLHKTGG